MKKFILGILMSILLCGSAFAENLKDNNSYSYFGSGQTIRTLKTGTAVLKSITVTGGTTGIIAVYDGTSQTGTPAASFTTTNTPNTYQFNIVLTEGLTVVTSAATQLTVSYK